MLLNTNITIHVTLHYIFVYMIYLHLYFSHHNHNIAGGVKPLILMDLSKQ